MPSGASGLGPNANLRFVTGKGGVGKTTIAAAYSVLAARDGRRVLAVDVLNRGDLADRLADQMAGIETSGLAGPPQILGLTTAQALDEYIKRYLRIPIAPSNLGPLSRIFDFVSAAAPGVKEILTIGKIGHETVNGPWDDVIVDAPASGHVIEMLAAPASLSRLTPSGPLASQTLWLQQMLDSPTTAVTVVATPEELPLAETEQLLARLRAETNVCVDTLVINRVPPAVSDAGLETTSQLDLRSSTETPRSVVRSLQALIAVAIDRDLTARPFIELLRTLAIEHELAVIEIADDPLATATSVVAAMTGTDTPGKLIDDGEGRQEP